MCSEIDIAERRRTRSEILVDHIAFWVSASVVAAMLTLCGARLARMGFSIFRWAWDSRDVYWVAPLGYLLVFAPVLVVLLAVSIVRPGAPSLRVTAGLWIALVAFSFLLLFPAIHGYAWMIVAGGIGVHLSRAVASKPQPARRALHRLALVCGAAACLLPFAVLGWHSVKEKRQLASLPSPPAGAPNVLLIILDTVRWKSLSLYGFPEATTPGLTKWASRGVVFDQAYATAPWTLPSHASMFTGQYATTLGARRKSPLDGGAVTLAEVLRDAGWATAGFTTNLEATRYESGLGQGFTHYEDFPRSLKETVLSTTITQSDNLLRSAHVLATHQGPRAALQRLTNLTFDPRFSDLSHDRKSAQDLTDAFLRWSAAAPTGRPFFAFINYFDAHSPYQPPEPYLSMYAENLSPPTRYLGAIRYIDEQLDRLFDTLERRKLLSNTIVVVTADHGEQFGEHGLVGHGNSMYAQVLHVPLLIMAPGRVPAGTRVAREISLRDLAATLLDLTGVAQPNAIGGTSLAAGWLGRDAALSEVVAEDNNTEARRLQLGAAMKAIVTDSLQIIRTDDAVLEVYRYRSDPENAHNLATELSSDSAYIVPFDRALNRNALEWPPKIVFPPAQQK